MYKKYTTFPEQNFADSQQGHIERLFFVTMAVSKVYAIYLSLCLFLHAYRSSNKKMSTYSDNKISRFIISRNSLLNITLSVISNKRVS